jgi:NAD(P)-dependent dehydrogenase (short-subunit alcohol dehydrogenase family)
LTEERRSAAGMLGKGLRLLVALGDHPEGASVSQLARIPLGRFASPDEISPAAGYITGEVLHVDGGYVAR